MSNKTDQETLWELIKDVKFGMLTHRHRNGELHAHPLTTQNKDIDEGSHLYFFISEKSGVAERLREDAVYMNHGFGVHSKGMSRANGQGIADDDLITKPAIDPIMGGTAMRGNFVKIVKGA